MNRREMKKFLENISPVIHHKHLLLDTNFLIEAYQHPEAYSDLRTLFSDQDSALTTIDLVVAEFMVGVRSIQEFRTKRDFVDDMIDVVLPLTKEISDNLIEKIVPLYGDNKSRSIITDLYLAAFCMKFEKGILLITRNYNDFMPSLFKLLGTIPIQTPQRYDIYGVYCFSAERASNTLDKFIAK